MHPSLQLYLETDINTPSGLALYWDFKCLLWRDMFLAGELVSILSGLDSDAKLCWSVP